MSRETADGQQCEDICRHSDDRIQVLYNRIGIWRVNAGQHYIQHEYYAAYPIVFFLHVKFQDITTMPGWLNQYWP